VAGIYIGGGVFFSSFFFFSFFSFGAAFIFFSGFFFSALGGGVCAAGSWANAGIDSENATAIAKSSVSSFFMVSLDLLSWLISNLIHSKPPTKLTRLMSARWGLYYQRVVRAASGAACPRTERLAPLLHQMGWPQCTKWFTKVRSALMTLQPSLKAISERDIVSCQIQTRPTRTRRIN
jgi:hypothetical protein